MPPRYRRFISEPFFKALGPAGPWNYLISDLPIWRGNDAYCLDFQLRENDTAMVYHGRTVLLNIHWIGDGIRTSADDFYTSFFPTAMGDWKPAQARTLRAILHEYFPAVMSHIRNHPNPRYKGFYRNEGYWQNIICTSRSMVLDQKQSFLVLDRECVLGFKNTQEKDAYYNTHRDSYQDLQAAIMAQDPRRFGAGHPHSLGDELDMLLLRPQGRLACNELKHGNNAAGIYWGPLQVSVYNNAFAEALPAISEDIKTLIRQKVRLGLLNEAALTWLPTAAAPFALDDRILAVSEPNPRSSCWDKMAAVLRQVRQGIAQDIAFELWRIQPPPPGQIQIEHL